MANFEEILGHQQALRQLLADIEEGNVAHAYLLSGPADVGKFTVAKLFARMLQTRNLEPVEAKIIQKQMDNGSHLDTMCFLNDGESLKIEKIRETIYQLQMTGNGNFRVVLVEDVDRLTLESANALLKTLEEPASQVIFILTTSHPQRLPETILSRVRVVNFSLLEEEEILKNLREKFPFTDPQKTDRVAVLAMGRIAKALKLLAHEELFEAYEKLFSDTQNALLSKNIPKAFALIKDVAEDEVLTQIFMEITETLLRKDLLQEMENGNNYDIIQQKILLIEKLHQVKALLTTNVNVRLMLENFVLAF